MPAGSAGILSFYQEKTDSVVKIRPELVIGFGHLIECVLTKIKSFVAHSG
jgi:preprotein translocase subunit Sec61beta